MPPFCAVCGVPFSGFCVDGDLPDNVESETLCGLFYPVPQSYDASALSLDHVKWVLEFEMLILDPGTPHRRLEKTCWSLTGLMQGSTRFCSPFVVCRQSDTDTHFPGSPSPEDIFDYRCYSDSRQDEPAFPVHKECQAMLERVLVACSNSTKQESDDSTEEPDQSTNGPDLEALHAAFRTLTSGSTDTKQNVLLGVQYHEPLMPYVGPRESGPMPIPGTNRVTHWNSALGWEFLLASPSSEDYDSISADLKRNIILSSTTIADRSARVSSDPFSALPWELLDEILRLVDNASLLRLTQASWHVHYVLHGNDQFWQARLEHYMDWFPELQNYLEYPWLGVTQHPKALFLWAMGATEAKQGVRGPYMNIANRRRIWHVCRQIADCYAEILLHRPAVVDPVAPEIRDEAWTPYLPLVAHPVTTIVTASSDAFWLCSWDETGTEMVLETFWDVEGSLVGMSVAPRGKRRLVGMDDSQHGVHKVSAIIPWNDWIREIVFHIPRLKDLNVWPRIYDMPYLSPQGMTVHFFDRPSLEIGHVGSDQCQRLFRAQEDATIVGVKGQIGVVAGHRRIIRFGIIQAPSPDRDTSQPFLKRRLPPAELHLWAAHPSHLDGRRIWDLPDLHMRAYGDNYGPRDDLSDVCHIDLVPLEAFIWAMTSEECESLVQLSAFHVRVHDGTTPPHLRDVTVRIGSLRAEYTAQSGLAPRQVGGVGLNGRLLPTDDIRKFDIDGAGGEHVVSANTTRWGDDLQLATEYWTRGKLRTTDWGNFCEYEVEGRYIEPGVDRHVGVGMAVALGIHHSGHTVMTVGALLTLPQSTVGENVVWHDDEDDSDGCDDGCWEDNAVELPLLYRRDSDGHYEPWVPGDDDSYDSWSAPPM